MDFSKLLSARFLCTVLIVGTYCLAILWCLWFVTKDKIEINAFLGIFVGFAGLASQIVSSYFGRKRNEKDTTNNNSST